MHQNIARLCSHDFFIINGISIGGWGLGPPPGYAYDTCLIAAVYRYHCYNLILFFAVLKSDVANQKFGPKPYFKAI